MHYHLMSKKLKSWIFFQDNENPVRTSTTSNLGNQEIIFKVNEKIEREIKETIPLTNAKKRIK